MSDLSKFMAEISNNFSVDYDKLLKEFSDRFGSGLPNVEKVENLRKDFFNYSIDFSKKIALTYIEEYHKWLLQNYDLKPKN